MEKKGVNLLMENLVYILLVLAFIAGMFFAITRVGSQATLDEQIGAKQIALIINKAEPGMEIELDILRLSEVARKNRFNGNIVTIDNDLNKVNVKLVNGNGYDYYFFNDIDVVRDLKKNKECKFGVRCLTMKFVEVSENG